MVYSLQQRSLGFLSRGISHSWVLMMMPHQLMCDQRLLLSGNPTMRWASKGSHYFYLFSILLDLLGMTPCQLHQLRDILVMNITESIPLIANIFEYISLHLIYSLSLEY